jgi:hypothetical protein
MARGFVKQKTQIFTFILCFVLYRCFLLFSCSCCVLSLRHPFFSCFESSRANVFCCIVYPRFACLFDMCLLGVLFYYVGTVFVYALFSFVVFPGDRLFHVFVSWATVFLNNFISPKSRKTGELFFPGERTRAREQIVKPRFQCFFQTSARGHMLHALAPVGFSTRPHECLS